MITKHMYLRSTEKAEWRQEVWYLFGFIPLYARDLSVRARKRS